MLVDVPVDIPPPAELGDDLFLLFTALAAVSAERVRQAVADAGFPDLRQSHGYVFQHLQQGPIAVSELAGRLGVTAQAASKSVIELERLGYLVRHNAETDQRLRLVGLTDKGWAAIGAGRTARAAVNAELRAALGAEAGPFARTLRTLAETSGALTELAARRLRP